MAQKMLAIMDEHGKEVCRIPSENIHNVMAMYQRKGLADKYWFTDPENMENLKRQQESVSKAFKKTN